MQEWENSGLCEWLVLIDREPQRCGAPVTTTHTITVPGVGTKTISGLHCDTHQRKG